MSCCFWTNQTCCFLLLLICAGKPSVSMFFLSIVLWSDYFADVEAEALLLGKDQPWFHRIICQATKNSVFNYKPFDAAVFQWLEQYNSKLQHIGETYKQRHSECHSETWQCVVNIYYHIFKFFFFYIWFIPSCHYYIIWEEY